MCHCYPELDEPSKEPIGLISFLRALANIELSPCIQIVYRRLNLVSISLFGIIANSLNKYMLAAAALEQIPVYATIEMFIAIPLGMLCTNIAVSAAATMGAFRLFYEFFALLYFVELGIVSLNHSLVC